ncbi:unnamed protein product [Diamesa hyperborea]
MGYNRQLTKKLEKCNHPNSRKTLALVKTLKKIKSRDKIKKQFAARSNVQGKKLVFFAEKIEGKDEPVTPEEFEAFIEEYFTRFDDEMEQIDLKRQINSKRGNQHASRESIIKMNLEQETKNFAAGGIELPDLCDPVAFKKFKEWNGNSHSIQHLDVRFISRRYLNELKPTVGLK